MTTKELRSKPDTELQKLLAEKRNELREARFKHAARQLKNVMTLRNVKSDIARIQTIVRERAIAATLSQNN